MRTSLHPRAAASPASTDELRSVRSAPAWRPLRACSPMLPLSGAGRAIAVVALIDSTGTGLFLAGSAIFFTRVIGVTSAEVGLGLSAAGLLGLLVSVGWGAAMDRLGARRILVVLSLWRALGYAALAFARGPFAFFGILCFIGMADRSVAPATQLFVAEAVGSRDRVRTMATVRSVRNVGFTMGALLAAIALHVDSPLAYQLLVLSDALTFAVGAALIARIRVAAPPTPSPSLRGLTGPRLVFSDRRYLAVTVLNSVLALHMTLLTIGIPLWVVNHTRADKAILVPLLVVNTVLTVLFQVRTSRRATTVAGAGRCLRRAGVALALACVLLAAAGELPAPAAAAFLVAAVVAQTVAELLQAAGGWELSYELAPEDRRGAYLSVFAAGTTVQQIVGPILLGAVVIATGPLGFLGLAVVFLVAGAAAEAVPKGVRGAAAPHAVRPATTPEPRHGRSE